MNDDATGIINANDIITFIESNGSNVDSCFVTSITKIDGNFLAELVVIQIFVYILNIMGHPMEMKTFLWQLQMVLLFYDDGDNQFPQISLTSEIPLYDILPPSIDSISVQIDSLIVLMESNPITFNFNEKVDSFFLQYLRL